VVVQAANIKTNRKFRDTNAWYHIVVAIDTTQGTAADRIKFMLMVFKKQSFSQIILVKID
jgi:hypothetical protein